MGVRNRGQLVGRETRWRLVLCFAVREFKWEMSSPSHGRRVRRQVRTREQCLRDCDPVLVVFPLAVHGNEQRMP